MTVGAGVGVALSPDDEGCAMARKNLAELREEMRAVARGDCHPPPSRLGAPGDIARRALEAFGIAEYQAERMTESELRRMLSFETRYELDGFLKERGVFHAYAMDDLRREQET